MQGKNDDLYNILWSVVETHPRIALVFNAVTIYQALVGGCGLSKAIVLSSASSWGSRRTRQIQREKRAETGLISQIKSYRRALLSRALQCRCERGKNAC